MISGACNFCDSPAVARCSWPVERFVIARYDDLQVGDRVRRAIDRLHNRPPATVVHIAPWFPAHDAPVATKLQVILEIRGKEKEIIVMPESRVQVLRGGPVPRRSL